MPDTDESTYRRHYRATAEDVTVREPDEVDTEDDIFEIRMPIATTGQVRNDGDDPLTRSELNGMARQINDRQIGVFPAHGSDDMIAFGKYSPFERLGDWQDASLETRAREDGDDEAMLMATARMPNPEELPAATGEYRKALAIIKEQASRGIAQDASIGWRDDDEFPGGVDLMEASIVGIGADWRTNTGDEDATTTAGVVARAAVDAGADPDALVDAVRGAVEPHDPDMEQDHDMTDDDPTDDPEEQDADDGETSDRAPDDVSADELLTFAAVHLDGMDEGGLAEAINAADAEYVGSVDLEELFDLVSVVTGAEYDAVADAMHSLMGGEQGDKPEDDEEGDEDEQAADAEQDADDPDGEQSGETDAERDLSEQVEELQDTVESYREELDKLREGGLSADDVETPDTDDEQDAEDDTDTDEGADESRESDGLDDLGNYR